jgi:DNA-binding LacI/PurR family transcriptional regulator
MSGVVEKFKNNLKKDIDSGLLSKNEKLPSIRALSGIYNVSTASVKRAIDELQKDGVVVAIHGKGIFIGGTAINRRRIGSKIIGAILLKSSERESIDILKNQLLADGWIFAVYDAGTDLQSPEKEKLFLQQAEKQGFAGIVMMPTPRLPLNSELYHHLRLLGIKLVMVSPYRRDMQDECYCLCDHAAGVELAIKQSIEAGYRNIAYLGSRYPHFSYANITYETYLKEMKKLHLQVMAPKQDKNSHYNIQETEWVRNLPPKTMILGQQAENATMIRQITEATGRKLWDDIGITNLFGEYKSENHDFNEIYFDINDMLKTAVEFIINDKTTSVDKFHKLIPPRIRSFRF